MNYCNVIGNKKHLLNLISWIFNEVKSSGGDGDFLWYSRFYNIKDLYSLFEEYNHTLKFKWDLRWMDEKTFICESSQEWIIVSNNEDCYKNAPSWQQGILKY